MASRTFNRRNVLMMGAAGVFGSVLPSRPVTAAVPQAALAESDLIYVTPLHGDGRESTCQAEVWFVADGSDAYVVTASGAWRARAVSSGLTGARVWVGDVGVWRDSGGAYRKLPSMEVRGALVSDPAEHERVLERFGAKYALEWIMWGPRFRKGLADGSRVMLRYRPVG